MGVFHLGKAPPKYEIKTVMRARRNASRAWLRNATITVALPLEDIARKIFVLDDRIEAVMNVCGVDRVIVRLQLRRAER
jgi:hypothetical protein